MPEDIRAAHTIDLLISQTWGLVYAGKCADPLVKHLEFVLGEYTRQQLNSVPPSTLWLANEVIDLSNRQ